MNKIKSVQIKISVGENTLAWLKDECANVYGMSISNVLRIWIAEKRRELEPKLKPEPRPRGRPRIHREYDTLMRLLPEEWTNGERNRWPRDYQWLIEETIRKSGGEPLPLPRRSRQPSPRSRRAAELRAMFPSSYYASGRAKPR